MKVAIACAIVTFLAVTACQTSSKKAVVERSDNWFPIKVSSDGHYFQYENSDPFFWLGDTGWLLFKKLNRDDAAMYLETRKQQGYNVIQVMLLHEMSVTNWQGTPALLDEDAARPHVTSGNDPNDSTAYDYWDHVEYVIDLAAEKGLWMALVPVWGSNVKAGKVNEAQASAYGTFLSERFGDKPNIIWLNGGDVVGEIGKSVWNTLGSTIHSRDSQHLMTFHPRGRRMSSEWFHEEPWLDFNMFQSGHRVYNQDTARDSYRFGPDNWKYVAIDWQQQPAKPTLDGEPSYEEIPHGLHDPSLPYWGASDVRRYAYWSVFAGGAGFTYGHNSIMQFYREADGEEKAYGAKSYWQEAIHYPGAVQMKHLKNLMLAFDYFTRVPAPELVVDQGEQYEYQAATKGKGYVLVYTYTGREIHLKMGALAGEELSAQWFNPRTGAYTDIGKVANAGTQVFRPEGETENGNDWVLVLRLIST